VEQINTKQDTIQKRVDNYLKHDMIKFNFLPMNLSPSLSVSYTCTSLANNLAFDSDIHSNKHKDVVLVPSSSQCSGTRDTCT
jgi:hypothetical protein